MFTYNTTRVLQTHRPGRADGKASIFTLYFRRAHPWPGALPSFSAGLALYPYFLQGLAQGRGQEPVLCTVGLEKADISPVVGELRWLNPAQVVSSTKVLQYSCVDFSNSKHSLGKGVGRSCRDASVTLKLFLSENGANGAPFRGNLKLRISNKK